MKPATRADLLPWALGAAACLFYLSFHSTFYNFDGVACAIAVELSDFPHLVHGNHLAYGILGWVFYRLWQALGYAGGALLPLQVLDSLLGGAGVGLFASLALRLRASRPLAALSAAGLAVCQAYWLWSLEAQVYLLGTFFVLLAAREALSESPRPALVGLHHGLAVLGHVGHVLFLPVALYLLGASSGRRKRVARYAATLALSVLAAYAAAAALCVRPQNFEAWRVWLLGSAALTLDKSFIWYGGWSWENLGHWALMTLRLFCDPLPMAGRERLIGWSLGGLALGAAAASALGLGRRKRPRIVVSAWLWVGSYALLYCSWQPTTVMYRISDLIPLWILIFSSLETWPKPLAAAALAAWVASAGLLNGKATILPQTDPARNREYQEALWIAQVTPQEAWIVVSARNQVYAPYFAHRRPLNMRYYSKRLPALGRRLEALASAGEPVFISSETLHSSDWAGFFRDYGLEQAARGERERAVPGVLRKDLDAGGGGERLLWRIRRRGSRGGAGRRGP